MCICLYRFPKEVQRSIMIIDLKPEKDKFLSEIEKSQATNCKTHSRNICSEKIQLTFVSQTNTHFPSFIY